MEYVDGQTLPCPVPVGVGVEYARQIAEALEYAHERGVIHRDLKPANVKVTADGVVTLLDFGLAKALDTPSGFEPDVTHSPTLTLGATRAGVILGTAAYMSPEQANGRCACAGTSPYADAVACLRDRLPDGTMMAVEIAPGASFQPGTPQRLFQTNAIVSARYWDVTADGKRFLVGVLGGRNAQTPFTVIPNWHALLAK